MTPLLYTESETTPLSSDQTHRASCTPGLAALDAIQMRMHCLRARSIPGFRERPSPASQQRGLSRLSGV